MVEREKIVLVTVEGECFSCWFKGVEGVQSSDRVDHLFELGDLVSGRGELLVSLRVFGPTRIGIADFSNRLESLRWNMVRRNFDQKILTFDEHLISNSTYRSFEVNRLDFQALAHSAPDALIRQFLLHKSYWVGYKLSENPERHWVDFDNQLDLEYLGISKADITRNLWVLEGQGLLIRKGALRTVGRPTQKLVEFYESRSALELPGEKVFPKATQYESFRDISGIIQSASSELIIVDNYVHHEILDILVHISASVKIKILTRKPCSDFHIAIRKFREQYQRIIEARRHGGDIHDRFIVVDRKDFYLLGASIKDAGNTLWVRKKLENSDEVRRLLKSLLGTWESATLLVAGN